MVFKKLKRSFMKMGLIRLKARVLVVGLCNSGKTSIVKALAGQVVADAVPTAGFEVETFKLSGKDKVKFTTYDMSGDPKYRCLWDSFYADAQGVLFVVDAAHKSEFGAAKATLHNVLDKAKPEMPVLVLCNKCDLPDAEPPQQLAAALGVDSAAQKRQFKIMGCSAINEQGLQEGIDWMTKSIRATM